MMSSFLSQKSRRKTQSALEYLLIYGWMFAVIIVVGASLWYLGIFSPNANQELVTEQSFGTSIVGVSDHVLYSTGEWKLGLISRGYNVLVNYICIDDYCFNINSFLGPRDSKIVSGSFDFKFNDSTKYSYSMIIDYTRLDSGLDHKAYGVFSGYIEHKDLPANVIVHDYEQDFSPGTFVNTTASLFSGYVSLSLKEGWYDYSYPYRKRYLVSWNGSGLAYPIEINISNIDANLVVVDGRKVPFYQNNNYLLFSYLFDRGDHIVDVYYGLPIQAEQMSSTTYINDEGKVDNGVITFYLGNRNNPTQWGIDSLFLDAEGTDLVNYNTFLLNYSNPLNYSFICDSSLFCTVDLVNSSIRVFANSSLFRYYFNSTYLYLGTDSSVLNCVDDYCFSDNRVSLELKDKNYVRFYNQSTNLSLVIYFPEQMNITLHLSGFNNESKYIVFDRNVEYVDILLSNCFEQPSWKVVYLADEERFNQYGYYISPVIDSNSINSDYSYLNWHSKCRVYLSIRAGNTVEECSGAAWYGPISGGYYIENGTIPSFFDGKRYIQYKAYFLTDDEKDTPLLDKVEIVLTR